MKEEAKRSSSREKGQQFSDVVDSIQKVISNDGRQIILKGADETFFNYNRERDCLGGREGTIHSRH
jgi:hypothetical protein